MAGETSIVNGVLTDFLTPVIPKIGGEPTIEGLIKIHLFISGNVVSVASNLGGSQHVHLALTTTAEEYLEQTGFVFVSPDNPGDYPQSMCSAQEQALGTEKSQQKQALFRKYTAMGGVLKK